MAGGRQSDRNLRKRHIGQGSIVVGSACSGISSDLLALEMLQVNFVSCFACELNPKLRSLGEAVHQHCQTYEDCCTETFLASRDCDVFTAGFPCQPFSRAGKNQGVQDAAGRGLVVFWLLRWIWLHRPKAFILENVSNFAHQHRDTLQVILDILDEFGLYKVEWKVLDCCKVGWIPQHRERLFICGVLHSCLKSPLTWPTEVQRQPLSAYFDRSVHAPHLSFSSLNRTEQKNVKDSFWRIHQRDGYNAAHEMYVIDVSGTKPHFMWGVSPCLTVARAGSSGHWLSWLARKMTTAECLKLQGISINRVGAFHLHLSEREMRQAAGNSVPVPMLARVMDMVLKASGMRP